MKGYERLTHAATLCWSLAGRTPEASSIRCTRRRGSRIAAEALCWIAELYAIEASINGRTVEQRQQVHNVRTRPLIEAMKPWLENELMRTREPRRPGDKDPLHACALGRAIPLPQRGR